MLTRTSRLRELERSFDRERQRWERERGELLDRIMHMGDRTWTPPPPGPEREPRVDEFTVDENPEGSLDDYYGWPTVAEVE